VRTIFAWTLCLALPVLAQDQVWRWVDESGEEHYTNDKPSIPEKFRGRASSTSGDELSVLKTTPPSTAEPIAQAPRKPTAIRAVLFEASTQSASKTLRRSGVLEKLVADNPGLALERVEFATAVDRAEKLNVTQLPTVLFLDGAGLERGRASGLLTVKELQRELDKARGALR
jgi:hypothetical protein